MPEGTRTTAGVLDDELFVKLIAERVVRGRAIQAFVSAFFNAAMLLSGSVFWNSGVAFLRLFGDGGRSALSPSASSVSRGNFLELGSASLPSTYAPFSMSMAETSLPESFFRRSRSSATLSKRALYSLIV